MRGALRAGRFGIRLVVQGEIGKAQPTKGLWWLTRECLFYPNSHKENVHRAPERRLTFWNSPCASVMEKQDWRPGWGAVGALGTSAKDRESAH